MIAHYDHKKNQPPHSLVNHTNETRQLAVEFASSFDPYGLTESSAMLHDVGKKSRTFQLYIQDPHGIRGSVKHAIGGAYVLRKRMDDLPTYARIVALFAQYIIAGHHSGLLDMGRTLEDKYQSLPKELENIESIARAEVDEVITLLKRTPTQMLKPFIGLGEEECVYFATLIRFCLSAMVDADWLSTEAYFSMEHATKRHYSAPSFLIFQRVLDKYCQKKFESETDVLAELKKQVQLQAREAGEKKHSFFMLHAPTGSGKTIAALHFALSHAIEHKKKRIVVALPLSNLTGEISAFYRNVFGKEHVVEDHSNAPVNVTNEFSSVHLAAENWDRPFIVCTTVQLMESLFHNKPLKVRKLHRLYGSVIILDEYHKLPLHVLRPILKQLDILQTYFGVTVVMMSATPYALSESRIIKDFKLMKKPLEIVNNQDVFNRMPKRVRFKWLKQKETLESLANRISQESTVLIILNTRKEAQNLFLTLKELNHSFGKVYHLSTTMCGDHRRRTLTAIHKDLNSERRIAVVSTGILEAGVDISFPVVYRMLAPLDALVQAAGRCNRYGKIQRGTVHIFELENSRMVDSAYKQGIDMTKRILVNRGEDALFDVQSFVTYYQKAFNNDENILDRYEIKEEKWLSFRTVASQFRMIEDERVAVICSNYRYFNREILAREYSRTWWRDIQPFTVSLHDEDLSKVENRGEIRILAIPYDDELGAIL